MKSIRAFFSGIFNRKVDAIGLSVFRIFYSLVLLCEISQLYVFRHVIYDKEPFAYVGEIDVKFLFGFWFIAVGCLIFGLFTRWAAIINYLFSVIIFSSAAKFEYHIFYAYVGMNLLMIFMPISRVLSLDSLIRKIRYTSIGRPFRVDRTILEINYLMPVFICIGLVYFDSIFLKFDNSLWTSGLGVWLPTSMPMIAWNDVSAVLDYGKTMIFLGYFVLIFETLFVFLFWFKKWRIPMMIIGMGLHLGILISYPIPWFALAFCCFYLLLIPPRFWRWIADRFQSQRPSYHFYYDAECPLCNKVIVAIRHVDIFKKVSCVTVQAHAQQEPALQGYDEETLLINIHGVTANGKVCVGFWAYVQLFKSMIYTWPVGFLLSVPGISHLGKRIYSYIAGDRLTVRCTEENCTLPVVNQPLDETQDVMIKGWSQLNVTRAFWKFVFVFFIVAQGLFIFFKPLVQNAINPPGFVNRILALPYDASRDFLVDYLGLTHHSVFLDAYFAGYDHSIRITYVRDRKEYELPLYDKFGKPYGYNTGVIWRNMSFNVVSARISAAKLEKGIVPYLTFYLGDKGWNGSAHTFRFYVRQVDAPKGWEQGFFTKEGEKPWDYAGSCVLEENNIRFDWSEKMQAIMRADSLGK